MFDRTELDRALTGTIFAGHLHYLSETGSTNADALAGALTGAPHGSVWLAETQTAGRGRGDHRWHSAPGDGLYVSLLFRLKLLPGRLTLMPFSVGLATIRAMVQVAGVAVDLRWPNDLLIDEKKAVGILIEAHTARNGEMQAVAGIGINVHQHAFPPDMATQATSLDLEAGRKISRQELLLRLLESLEQESRALEADDAGAAIPARIEAASSWIRGRRVLVHGPQACAGVTEGLDENGFLRVRTAQGVVVVQTGGIRAAEGE
jgi:BirA family biotin operon repressor/biotin-[acetyl-CoA-carboxylase] ligase